MDSLSNRLTGKVSVMSNKLRSFLIVVMSIVVVMAALPLNALRVYADGGEYEITYIANNGTDKEDTDYYTKGSSTEYTIKTIDDLGYMAPYGCEFDGWYTTAGSQGLKYGSSIPDSEFNDTDGNKLQIYARWAIDSVNYVNVTLEPNGVSGSTVEVIMPKTGGNAAAIAIPNPNWNSTGKVFREWSTNIDGTGDIYYGDSYAFSSDITLYAQWNDVCTITFHGNNGTGTMNDQEVAQGNNTTISPNGFIAPTTPSGLIFGCWNTAEDGSGTAYADQDTIAPDTSEIDLYAQWVEPCKITFEPGVTDNSVTGKMSDQTVGKGSKSILNANQFTRANYIFAGWKVSGDTSDTVYQDQSSVTFSADTTLVAQWKGEEKTVSLNINPAEGGSVKINNQAVSSGSYEYEYGKSVTISAIPSEGYDFVNWTDVNNSNQQVSDNADYTFSITNNVSYRANFVLKTYLIEATSADDTMGSVSGDASGNYQHYQNISFTASPNPGYHFVRWRDGAGQTVSTSQTYSFTASGECHLFAEFSDQYDISVTVMPSDCPATVSGTGSHTQDTEITLTANDVEGYTFKQWNIAGGTCVGTDKDLTVQVTGDLTYVAEYSINEYQIDYSVDGSGTVNNSTSGTIIRAYNGNVALTAVPATGYHFVKWIENGTTDLTEPATLSFPATKDRTLKAVFEIDTFKVNVTASSAEHGTVGGSGTYNYFSTATVTATPNTGYHFVNWTDENGTEVSTSASYSFEVDGARNLTANFAINSYSVEATAGDHGSVSGSGTYNHFSTCNLVATPDKGYHFAGWEENGKIVSEDADYSFTVTGDRSLKAVFEINMYTVTYKNDDGTILQQSEFAWGSTATYQHMANPTKKPTAQFTYTFAGWDNKVTLVTNDVTYTATYTSTVNKYKITFANEDGTVLQTGEIEYGKMPVYEKDTPTKAATVKETFTFAGWDKEISKVTGETVYTATYTATATTKDNVNYKHFTVTFESNGGSEVVTQLVADGGVAFKPEDPLRERYTFGGWYIDAALTKPFSFATAITSDITLYAKWTKGSPDVEATYAVIGLGSITVELGNVEDITVSVERSTDNDSIATHFKSVQIDGVEVDYYNYELTEDNSAVIIRADALEGLEAGNHTITIVYDDGTAEVELIVVDANEPVKTNEEIIETEAAAAEPVNVTAEKNSNTGMWIVLGIVAAVVIAAVPIFIIKARSLK